VREVRYMHDAEDKRQSNPDKDIQARQGKRHQQCLSKKVVFHFYSQATFYA
jgi:hypothetical protein